MLSTNRSAATVHKTRYRFAPTRVASLGLMAALAIGLAVPACAEDAFSLPTPDQATQTATKEWRNPARLGAPTRLASNLPATVPTIQDAFAANTLSAAARGGQVGTPISPGVYAALRLGLTVSPRVKFVGGVDVTLPKLSIGPGFTTRVDAEAIVSANFGGVSTLVPLTINEVYTHGLTGGWRIYGGAGIGPYFGDVTRFGGKVFIGAGMGRVAGELDLHFAGFGDPYLALMLRTQL
jgi:hypothetical protein